MKRTAVWGLVLVAVASLVLGNTSVTKNAETSPMEPVGISVFHK